MAKKAKDEFIISVPDTFSGEVIATKSSGTSNKIGLLTQEFGNGDLNVLRDKINEIINRG